jgi:hypothetical protein
MSYKLFKHLISINYDNINEKLQGKTKKKETYKLLRTKNI